MTEDGQKYEHNKVFEERCGIKRETITVVSLLFINLVIHYYRLALHNCVLSTRLSKPSASKEQNKSSAKIGIKIVLVTCTKD